MLDSQKLYGRHGTAQWVDGSIALGRSLTRTLPEDVHDRKPLTGAGGDQVLVADIRLDNRDELLGKLQISQTVSRNLCDAAVLLAALQRWDENCFEHLVGDYAFALWNSTSRCLLLARDPLGQRPLHYHRGANFLAFASMPKGLHSLPEIPYAPDEDRFASHLIQMPWAGSQTYFEGVVKVQPGQVVRVTTTNITSRRHWLPRRRILVLKNTQEYVEALRAHLDVAVRSRLRGAEEVGAHLSSGFDSSAVATTAARLLAPEGGKVVAFTAVPREGYESPDPGDIIVNEGPYAALTVASCTNMEHVQVRDGSSPLDVLDRNFHLLDEPVYSVFNTGWGNSICDAAQKRRLTVLLTGEFGDLGLTYRGLELLPELLRSGHWRRLLFEARALVANRGATWRMALAQTFGPWCPVPLWIILNQVRGRVHAETHSAIRQSRFAELDLLARAKKRGLDLANRPWKDGFAMRVWEMCAHDPGNHNKAVLGGWQIDERHPLADIRLLEFCLSVPTEQFLSKGRRRALARRALDDRVPSRVLDRGGRASQAADWHERLWASRDRVADELGRLDRCGLTAKLLDIPRMRRALEKLPSDSNWERADVYAEYRTTLVRGLAAGYFLRRVVGSNS
jgi:asparagine synthase (glutamine-hydrolysing)